MCCGLQVPQFLSLAVEDCVLELLTFTVSNHKHSPHVTHYVSCAPRFFCSMYQRLLPGGVKKKIINIPAIYSDFVVLLDNDFFGNPAWRDRIAEMQDLQLKVNFSQGLNIRNIKEEQAAELAKVKFRTLSLVTANVVTVPCYDPDTGEAKVFIYYNKIITSLTFHE